MNPSLRKTLRYIFSTNCAHQGTKAQLSIMAQDHKSSVAMEAVVVRNSSAVVEDVDIPILKASCHYKDQPSGFILLLQLNFWLMFILPLGVGICKIYERDIQSVLTGKHFFYMDMQSHA